MSKPTALQKKKKALSPEAADRRRKRNREYMRRLRQERKAAGIPMYSQEQKQKRLERYRSKYKGDKDFRERVKARSAKTNKERYQRDKSPWIKSQKKRSERIKTDEAYAKEMRAKAAARARKRYAASEEVRKKISERFKRWKNENPGYMRSYMRAYKTSRLRDDIEFWIRHAIRSRLNIALRRKYASGSAVRDLGCTIEEFISHIENQFLPGMSWNNRGIGGWHIDHIVPLAAFDLRDEDQRKKACHFSNMQPLWEADNLKKGRKMPADASASVASSKAPSSYRGAKCKTTVQRRKR